MNEDLINRLYGQRDHPIYIYVPGYIEESAGIRALHYLCHALNQSGHLSWLVVHGLISNDRSSVNAELNTPVLTNEIRDQHFKAGLAPIVIYPETIPGNPLKAQVVIRWILNYPGILGGPKTFERSDYAMAYSAKIAQEYSEHMPVLFLPPLDIREIEQARKEFGNLERTSEVLIYAGKYRGFVGNPILPRWAPSRYTEIWREGPYKQDRKEVLRLLATSSCLFIFENSTLITESVLLGCPVILIRSTFFDSLIAETELGVHGAAWSDEKDPMQSACSSIDLSEQQYIHSIYTFFDRLEQEAEKWNEKAKEFDYISPILLPNFTSLISRHRIALALQILRTQGFITLLRVVRSFFRRRFKNATRK